MTRSPMAENPNPAQAELNVDLPNDVDSKMANQEPKDPKADSPVLRSRMGVNSPRRPSKQMDFTDESVNEDTESQQESVHLETRANYSDDHDQAKYADDDDDPEPPNDLITQVPRKDEPRKEDDDDSPSGWSRLCSCLFSKKTARPPGPTPSVMPPARNQGDSAVSDDGIDVGNGLLGPPLPQHVNKKCLVLDLDETLVHSSFKPVRNPDFIVPVTIENTVHRVYVLKRPGVDEFLKKCGEVYEVVVFTASLSKYADPLLDILDPDQYVCARLFREACVLHCGTYVKDLSKLGRKLADTIIIDNSPQSYAFQPTNAIPIDSWFDDKNDTQLYDLLPFLLNSLISTPDVRSKLDASKPFSWLLNQT